VICKINTITHAKNALDYCEKGGELLHSNKTYGSAKEINSQFRDVHALKPKIKEKSIHAIISFNPEDRALNKGEMIDIVDKYAKKIGFDNNQYAVYLHEDKAHTHLHIVANRIGYDRKLVSASYSHMKSLDFSTEMEKEYSLLKTKRPTKGKDFIRDNKHNETLKLAIDECLKKSKNLDELGKNLKEQYSVTMHKGRGVSFMYQEGSNTAVKTKGSAIGREYSLKGLEKQIEELHNPKTIDLGKDFTDWYKDFKSEKTVKPAPTKAPPSKGLDINIDQNISSAYGKENFEDDDYIKKKKKGRNRGGMTP
jgi:hypothetical protein